MKEYDAIVIGSGCGLNIVNEALEHGQEVALVDRGPLGGTCPNLGCIPSKMLIHAADRVVEALEARKLGVKLTLESVDFNFIMERMRRFVKNNQAQMKKGLSHTDGLDFYEGEGQFIDEFTLQVNGETIKGKKIFIASGSRPIVPPIKGLETVDYLTSATLLQLKKCPNSLIIIGGGYIAVEYGHFFAAMGSKVTILEMADRLVLSEEPEIAKALQEELELRMETHTKSVVREFRRGGAGVTVIANEAGGQREYTAESVLIATGRRSNADILKVEKTGVELDAKSWIKVDEYLETSRKGIFAVGDANGTQMFTHVANREAMLVADAAVHDTHEKMDYSAAPHAVYTHPQIASVGMREEEARKTHKIAVGRASYFDVAQGEAMLERKGFAKAIVDSETNKLLGFHIIGPYAPIIIQEAVNCIANDGDIDYIARAMHIHPSITELVPRVISEAA